MLFNVACDLEYTARFPSTLILNVHAQRNASQAILEETFVHEAAHTSLDAAHANSAGWVSAQTKDVNFISTYARDNPRTEDVAESFLTWLAVRYRSSRITPALATTIQQTIPNRMAYFDSLGLVMLPIQ